MAMYKIKPIKLFVFLQQNPTLQKILSKRLTFKRKINVKTLMATLFRVAKVWKQLPELLGG